jgi:hypothetical protein
MNKSKQVMSLFEKEPEGNPKGGYSVPSPGIEKYPELDAIADKLAYDTAMKINKAVENVKSKMPYKSQYVLEELIKMLQAKV